MNDNQEPTRETFEAILDKLTKDLTGERVKVQADSFDWITFRDLLEDKLDGATSNDDRKILIENANKLGYSFQEERTIYIIKSVLQRKLTPFDINGEDDHSKDSLYAMTNDEGEKLGKFLRKLAKSLLNKPYFLNAINDCFSRSVLHIDEVEIRHLDWNAGDFGDHGSCFMTYDGCRHKYINSFDAHGIRGLCFYRNGKGFGRCLIYPRNENSFYVFNAYTISLRAVVSALSPNHNYHIYLENNNSTTEELWINSGNAYICNRKSIPNPKHTYDLGIDDIDSEAYSTCKLCGGDIEDEGDAYNVDGQTVCSSCFQEHASQCYRCGDCFFTEDILEGIDDRYYCPACARRLHLTQCDECNLYTENNIHTEDNYTLCQSCAEDVTQCDDCSGYWKNSDDLTETEDGYNLCEDCYVAAPHCHQCNAIYKESGMIDADNLCYKCAGLIECSRCHQIREPQVDKSGLAHVAQVSGNPNILDNLCQSCYQLSLDYWNTCVVCQGEADWTAGTPFPICRSCLDKSTTCADCGSIITPEKQKSKTGHGIVCPNCLFWRYFKCEICGVYHATRDMTFTQNYVGVCPTCRDAHVRQCPSCHTVYAFPENYLLANGTDTHTCTNCRSGYIGLTRSLDLYEESENGITICTQLRMIHRINMRELEELHRD